MKMLLLGVVGVLALQALLVLGYLAVREKYGLEMDMGSIPVLAERHGLLVDAPPPSGM